MEYSQSTLKLANAIMFSVNREFVVAFYRDIPQRFLLRCTHKFADCALGQAILKALL